MPGRRTSTSLSPIEYAFNVLPLIWGPGAVFTEPGSCVTNIRPVGGTASPVVEVRTHKMDIETKLKGEIQEQCNNKEKHKVKKTQ